MSLSPSAIGRRDLGVHHQIAAIAHHYDHLPIGRCHLDAQSASDFIAHTAVPVFEVVAARIGRLPKLVKLAGQSPGRTYDNIAGPARALHRPDHLRVGGQSVGCNSNLAGRGQPLGFKPIRAIDPGLRRFPSLQRPIERFDASESIADHRQAPCLPASKACTLTPRMTRAGFLKSAHDPVVKS